MKTTIAIDKSIDQVIQTANATYVNKKTIDNSLMDIVFRTQLKKSIDQLIFKDSEGPFEVELDGFVSDTDKGRKFIVNTFQKKGTMPNSNESDSSVPEVEMFTSEEDVFMRKVIEKAPTQRLKDFFSTINEAHQYEGF